MMLRSRTCAWVLGAVAVLTAAACSPASEEVTLGTDPDSATASGPGAAKLELCDDIAEIESDVMGNLEGILDQVRDPDPRYRAAIRRYGQEHAATHGGEWIDRDRRGLIVTTFTDDVEAHSAAIAALVPSMVKFDVVQVRFSERELLAVHRLLGGFMGPDYGLTGVGLGTKRNRVTLHFTDPPPGALAEMAQLAPPHMVCAEVFYSAEPPSGPLTVIPDLAADDPMVVCGRFGPMRYSTFLDPPSLDDVDHPAAHRLRAALDSPPGRLLPAGEYRVMDIGTDVVRFAAFSDEGIQAVTVVDAGDRWRIAGWGSDASSCEVQVVLPSGLGYVGVYLDAEAGPASDDGAVHLLARVSGCAQGRETGDALRGPQIVETDDEVLVAFAAVGASVTDDCVATGGFPWFTPVTIMLSESLGSRVLRDGTYLPPKAITRSEDQHSQSSPETTEAGPAESPTSSEPSAVATTAVPPTGTFSPCDDIPELESTFEGNLSGTQNPDDALTRIIRDYGGRHESFADLWIDREHGGALVAAFTGDVEAHREALAALLPDGTPFDVVVADYSTAELETVRAELQANMTDIEGLSHFGMRTTRNRVEIGLVDPPDATLDRLSELVPPALVCVDVFYSPEPPSGPLDIIPLVSGDDPLVECRGIGTVRSSRLVDPLSVDEVDHPAVEALRAELRSPGPEPLPTGDWSVMHIDEDSATFAIIDGNVIAGRNAASMSI